MSAAIESPSTSTEAYIARYAAHTNAITPSNTAMMRCLRTRSATTPPMGVSTTYGNQAHAITAPIAADEPVRLSTYKGKANHSTALPKSDITWAATNARNLLPKSMPESWRYLPPILSQAPCPASRLALLSRLFPSFTFLTFLFHSASIYIPSFGMYLR